MKQGRRQPRDPSYSFCDGWVGFVVEKGWNQWIGSQLDSLAAKSLKWWQFNEFKELQNNWSSILELIQVVVVT
jgi:hypothetical protein